MSTYSSKTKALVLVASALAIGCSGNMDPAAVKTLAVMPFEDATAQKDFGDLADAVTEHLTTTMGTAKGVNVIASSSAMQYKVRPRTLADIKERFQADALLEGDVDIAGETLTINAHLRATANDKNVWEKKVTGKREAAFVLAEDVAESAAQWLKKPLAIKKSVPAPSWQHLLFLMEGEKLRSHIDPVEVNLAVYDLEKLRGDYPDYWPARAPSAHLFGRLVATEFLTRDKAREWIKGIIYDTRQEEPNSAEAYYAEGTMKYYVDWDWAAAEALFKKAIEARPNLMYAWHSLAQLYVTKNQLPLALETMEKARKLDPLGYDTTREWAIALAANERWDEALKALDEAAPLTKNETIVTALRGAIQFAKGDYEAARISITALATGRDEIPPLQSLYGVIEAKLGMPAETKKMMTLFEARAKQKLAAADPIHFALLHLALGDSAKAYTELQSAVDQRRTLAMSLAGNPAFAGQHADSRFQAIVAKVAASKPIAVKAGSTPSPNQ